MVSTSEGLFVLGGRNDFNFQSSVYVLKCIFIGIDCFWDTMNLELALPRASFVALNVPDYFLRAEGSDCVSMNSIR